MDKEIIFDKSSLRTKELSVNVKYCIESSIGNKVLIQRQPTDTYHICVWNHVYEEWLGNKNVSAHEAVGLLEAYLNWMG